MFGKKIQKGHFKYIIMYNGFIIIDGKAIVTKVTFLIIKIISLLKNNIFCQYLEVILKQTSPFCSSHQNWKL